MLPIIREAIAITAETNGRIFPVPHHNTCLAGIRSVAKRCGITKHITWHESLHTAARTVFLSNGVPIETVSSMLEHKSIKTTRIYAKITKEKLNQDMEFLYRYVARLCLIHSARMSWSSKAAGSSLHHFKITLLFKKSGAVLYFVGEHLHRGSKDRHRLPSTHPALRRTAILQVVRHSRQHLCSPSTYLEFPPPRRNR